MTEIENYKISYRAKQKATSLLKSAGYIVITSQKNDGPFDLCAINEHEARLIQIKNVAFNKLPDFDALKEEIAKIKTPRNIKKELWVWEQRSGFHYFSVRNSY